MWIKGTQLQIYKKYFYFTFLVLSLVNQTWEVWVWRNEMKLLIFYLIVNQGALFSPNNVSVLALRLGKLFYPCQ